MNRLSEMPNRPVRTTVVNATGGRRRTPNPSDGNNAFIKTDQRLTDRQSLVVRYRADKNSSTGNSIGGLNTRERGTNTISCRVTSRLYGRVEWSSAQRSCCCNMAM